MYCPIIDVELNCVDAVAVVSIALYAIVIFGNRNRRRRGNNRDRRFGRVENYASGRFSRSSANISRVVLAPRKERIGAIVFG